MNNVTKPNFITKVYFYFIHIKIISFLNLNKNDVILDFGCGLGSLKKLIRKKFKYANIINYDVLRNLSEIDDWKKIDFNKIVFCQVLYLLDEQEITDILKFIKSKNKNVKIFCCFSCQGFLNRLFAYILGHKNAHTYTLTTPEQEEKLLLDFCTIEKKFNFFNIFKIFVLKFI